MYAVSPLRYPGAKWRLHKFIQRLIEINKLQGGDYVEPYAGGASLALSLLYSDLVKTIHLNDLDRSVWAFWHSLLNHNDEFVKRIETTPVTMAQWEIQRHVQLNADQEDNFNLGFSTFFLNRTNRSGILAGGVIGGKQQNGNWKIDARFNKSDLIKRIRRIGKYRERIQITHLDALELLGNLSTNLARKSLVYLDPPYFMKGQGLYLNAYRPDDHSAVRDTVLSKLTSPWVVSYDNVPEVRSLYKDVPKRFYDLNYSAGPIRTGKEVLFFAPGIHIPRSIHC
ncbi:MAG: DNA adenine methylase [Gloeobacterales cyanobacterium]|jgi:DNA adenine methylase